MYQRIILLIFLPLFAFSQAPQKINFQSILRNTNGEVVANKNVKLKISIQSGSMMDSTVYSETHLKTTDVSGLMSIKIGTGTVIMGRFDSIKWGKAPHFIKLEADFNGGNNFVLLGTQELMSVPYAFHSNTADSLVGSFNSQFQNIIDEVTNNINKLKNHFNLFDIDGNKYSYVTIGNQVWMAENLRVSRYRNGDNIQNVTDDTTWIGLTTGARCWYEYDSTLYEYPYGKLYNWYAVRDNRNICPSGWHVPSYSELASLVTYLGGASVAGDKLKSIGTAYWNKTNTGATNESGFSGLPGGTAARSGGFGGIRSNAIFWSSTEEGSYGPGVAAIALILYDYYGYAYNYPYFTLGNGFSVRCIRD